MSMMLWCDVVFQDVTFFELFFICRNLNWLQNKVSEEELTSFLERGTLNVLGHDLTTEEVTVSYCTSGDSSSSGHFETNSDSQV